MISTALIVGSLALAYLSPWWFIATALVMLWRVNHWWFYRSRPWRRIHYPAMRVHAGAIGFSKGRDERDGTETQYEFVLSQMVQAFFPSMSNEEIASLIRREYERCRTFADKQLVHHYLKRKNPKIDEADLDATLEKYRPHMRTDDKFAITRLVIAGIMEKTFSEDDRAEYMFEVLNGRAK